jgi:hypothetical protein
MTQDSDGFARTYSAMADEELTELYFQRYSLVGAAKQALQLEMERRGMKPEELKLTLQPTAVQVGRNCPGCGRLVEHPLTCGSCSTSICRVCGTPVELEWSDNDPREDDVDAAPGASR